MMELYWLGLVFLSASLGAWLVLRALRWLAFSPPLVEDPNAATARPPLFGRWTEAFASLLPMSAAGEERIRKALLKGGFYHRSALLDYRAVRSLMFLFPLLVCLEAALLWDSPTATLVTAVYGLVAAVLCVLLARLYLTRRGNWRSTQIRKGLPLAQDMLSLCLAAGTSLLAAFRQVAYQLRASHPVLAGEMEVATRQAELRSLGHALRQMVERVQVPEVSNLAFTLAQSDEMGTDSSAALLELSTTQRTTLRQEAEAQANRTSFWMLFPTALCLFTAAAIMVIGPGLLQLISEIPDAQKALNELPALIEMVNKPPPLPPLGPPPPPPPPGQGPPP